MWRGTGSSGLGVKRWVLLKILRPSRKTSQLRQHLNKDLKDVPEGTVLISGRSAIQTQWTGWTKAGSPLGIFQEQPAGQGARRQWERYRRGRPHKPLWGLWLFLWDGKLLESSEGGGACVMSSSARPFCLLGCEQTYGRQGQKQGGPTESDGRNPGQRRWGLDWSGGGGDKGDRDQTLEIKLILKVKVMFCWWINWVWEKEESQ